MRLTKEEAQKIYNLCQNKADIILILKLKRDFIKIMDKCDVLVANEGGGTYCQSIE
jgi:heptosyltransferase-2